jgi:macrodomain Ter protein organizer (MatP/YcbG family)
MPMEYSLEQIFETAPRNLWPQDFVDMLIVFEENPHNRQQLEPMADWLEEHHEPELATALRFVMRNESVEVEFNTFTVTLKNLPREFNYTIIEEHFPRCLVKLTQNIRSARRQLEALLS